MTFIVNYSLAQKRFLVNRDFIFFPNGISAYILWMNDPDTKSLIC